jgi:hypothetical protein
MSPRKTHTRSTRDPRKEIEAVQRATRRGAAEFTTVRKREAAEVAEAKEADAQLDGRDFDLGTPLPGHTTPALRVDDLDADPVRGLRTELARADRMLDKRYRDVERHAGTEKARVGAERNLEHLEREVQGLRDQVWAHDDTTRRTPCRTDDCANTVSPDADLRFGFCHHCYLAATAGRS